MTHTPYTFNDRIKLFTQGMVFTQRITDMLMKFRENFKKNLKKFWKNFKLE